MAAFVVTIRKHGKGCKVGAHIEATSGGVTTNTPAGIAPVMAYGDTVLWRNRSTDRIVVFVPSTDPFGAVHSEDIKNSADSKTPSTVSYNPSSGNSKTFPYAIWCDATNDWAVGNSDPEIIIEA
jgi:hypothetical protein